MDTDNHEDHWLKFENDNDYANELVMMTMPPKPPHPAIQNIVICVSTKPYHAGQYLSSAAYVIRRVSTTHVGTQEYGGYHP